MSNKKARPNKFYREFLEKRSRLFAPPNNVTSLADEAIKWSGVYPSPPIDTHDNWIKTGNLYAVEGWSPSTWGFKLLGCVFVLGLVETIVRSYFPVLEGDDLSWHELFVCAVLTGVFMYLLHYESVWQQTRAAIQRIAQYDTLQALAPPYGQWHPKGLEVPGAYWDSPFNGCTPGGLGDGDLKYDHWRMCVAISILESVFDRDIHEYGPAAFDPVISRLKLISASPRKIERQPYGGWNGFHLRYY